MPPLISVWHARLRPRSRVVISALLPLSLTLFSIPASAQGVRAPVQKAPRTIPLPRGTITISGGVMVPMAHDLVTDLWNPGPALSVAAYRTVNRLISLGFGAEAAYFAFNEGGFAVKYPGVTSHPLSLGYLHFYVGWRFQMWSGSGIVPTLGATVGASKLTRASHQERPAGVRITYYDIPGRFRLTGGATLGLDFPLSKSFALSLEGRALYLMNDPEASVLASGRLGMRFTLE